MADMGKFYEYSSILCLFVCLTVETYYLFILPGPGPGAGPGRVLLLLYPGAGTLPVAELYCTGYRVD